MTSLSPGRGRSRNGCLVCKSRKVKCGEELDGCHNCVRVGIPCPGYASGDSPLAPHARTTAVHEIFKAAGVSKREFGACQECRATKSRCTKEQPKCRRCQKKRQSCIYDPHPLRREQRRNDARSPSSPSHHVDSRLVEQDRSHHWLHSPILPQDPAKLKELANTYFDNIHPLRTLAFIHRPTFMQSLDRFEATDNYGDALIHIMCAFAARIIAPAAHRSETLPGEPWVKKSLELAFQNLGTPSLQTLMALVLLCEYHMRYGRSSAVFMLSSNCFRMAQLLRLDAEPVVDGTVAQSTAAQITDRESKRRLMWSCYILDILVGSGIDSLVMSFQSTPSIQLPCQNQAFTLQIVSETAALIPSNISMPAVENNLGLEAYFVRVVYIRGQVLRIIRQTKIDCVPWESGSDFLDLEQKLDALGTGLPSHIRLDDLNTYIHRDQHQLGALFALHLAYHQCYCDLYRVVLPGYQFPIAKLFATAPVEFVQRCQVQCRQHAEMISQIASKGSELGQESFSDPLCGICIYESTKIQVIYMTCLAFGRNEVWDLAVENVKINLRALHLIESELTKVAPYTDLQQLFSLCRLLQDFGFSELAASCFIGQGGESTEMSETNVPEFHNLHPLATFQRSWHDILWSNTSRSTDQRPQVSTSHQPPPSASASRSTAPEPARLPLPDPINRRFIDEPSGTSTPSLLEESTDQYLLMAEGMQDFLTWDPMLVDFNQPHFHL